MDGIGRGRVEVIASKGCSRLFRDFSSSFRSLQSFSLEPTSPTSSAPEVLEYPVKSMKSNSPFSGLVICVTGLSIEARKQVKKATEKLGGQYSPHLHPQCTHLVVQSSHGHKFEHALKHGPRNGLFLVTISWFVDSVKKNERLNESLYRVNHNGETGAMNSDSKRLDQNTDSKKSSHPVDSIEYSGQSGFLGGPHLRFSERHSKRIVASPFSGQSIYVDNDVSSDLCSKVAEAVSAEGASLLDQWYVGCDANYIVCEGSSVRKYLGHSCNLVTPAWVLKSAKENCVQRLVHMSADLAGQTGSLLGTIENGIFKEGINGITHPAAVPRFIINKSQVERQNITNLAKDGVRRRRNLHMRTCKTRLHPITPSSLLDSICWSISEPTSSASIYTYSSSAENGIKNQTCPIVETKEDVSKSGTSFVNLSRPLTESEKSGLIFKSHFLTILFPIDRYLEMGPRSRTFFSEKGFACLQVLDYIYAFYQENMSTDEIEVAIHTDSRNADRLRLAYSSKETAELKLVEFKRIDFLGSRISFEMLKRVNGDNDSNVYELLIRA
ncbi:Hypothetical predicted protein [Olea europaea subsp. europaea]|uniref:BRCT domain-containing protein n=1 Tax=Olea europaea subsp. europaea TaxID=158383 RepID=A0A8S0PR93_OLEEU|nr:Hypothetical predicted protein [Olea europaea subsp. europaea]